MDSMSETMSSKAIISFIVYYYCIGVSVANSTRYECFNVNDVQIYVQLSYRKITSHFIDISIHDLSNRLLGFAAMICVRPEFRLQFMCVPLKCH